MYTTALDEDNYIVAAQNAMLGLFRCRCCGKSMVATVNSLENLFGFNHNESDKCDCWYEASEWNMKWQRVAPIEYRETPIMYDDVKHIADIKIGKHTIIFQDLFLPNKDFYEKLAFFQSASSVIWVQNCLNESITNTGEAKFGGNKYHWSDPKELAGIKWSEEKKWRGQHYLFLQVKEDMFIEVSWNAEGFRNFTGEYIPREDFIRRIHRLMVHENISYNRLFT